MDMRAILAQIADDPTLAMCDDLGHRTSLLSAWEGNRRVTIFIVSRRFVMIHDEDPPKQP